MVGNGINTQSQCKKVEEIRLHKQGQYVTVQSYFENSQN